jgi:hypothetical protein
MDATKVDSAAVEQARSELDGAIARLGLAADHTLVISYEGFSGSIRGGYGNASFCAQILGQILSGHAVTVVMYLRPQDSFIESSYTQQIHQGESMSIEDFLGSLPPRAFDWSQLVQAYSEVFGAEAIRVRPFSKLVLTEPDSVLRDFCEQIGCSFLSINDDVINKNVGYSRDALEVARLVNPSLTQAERVNLRLLLQETSRKVTWASYSYLTGQQRADIRREFGPSNEQVSRKYLGCSWDSLFPLGEFPTSYQGLNLSGLSKVMIELILKIQSQNETQIRKLEDENRMLRCELAEKVKSVKGQIGRLKERSKPLLTNHTDLELIGQSRVLRYLGKWERELKKFLRR